MSAVAGDAGLELTWEAGMLLPPHRDTTVATARFSGRVQVPALLSESLFESISESMSEYASRHPSYPSYDLSHCRPACFFPRDLAAASRSPPAFSLPLSFS
jgi:hypothetical protein